MGLMTPTEAFDPNREGGDDPDADLDEADEAEETAGEDAMKETMGADGVPTGAPEGAEAIDAMSPEKMEKINKIKEMIKKGKLKGDKLDEALKTVGFSLDDIKKLADIQKKGNIKKKLIKRN